LLVQDRDEFACPRHDSPDLATRSLEVKDVASGIVHLPQASFEHPLLQNVRLVSDGLKPGSPSKSLIVEGIVREPDGQRRAVRESERDNAPLISAWNWQELASEHSRVELDSGFLSLRPSKSVYAAIDANHSGTPLYSFREPSCQLLES
jgi:hypothetical protein